MREGKHIFLGFLILFISVSCGKDYKVIEKFPESMQGVWKQEYEDIYWKINSNKIYLIDKTTEDTDTTVINTDEIRRTGRANCKDCANWGIEIVIQDGSKSWRNFYLDNYNELKKNFDELLVIPSMKSSHDNQRTYFSKMRLNRIYNPN
ncbi:hypothetical protein [Fodinibius sp.]|uniref:hypothetical protein n=1 Tax=Fodinibius sp. TaxID=1872440 RepID=UPI002ACE28CC|nr:hypothetical protein [Fodinibius sp.]MDZ7657783.1 hypothetical protein [Fodinibius sp.]